MKINYSLTLVLASLLWGCSCSTSVDSIDEESASIIARGVIGGTTNVVVSSLNGVEKHAVVRITGGDALDRSDEDRKALLNRAIKTIYKAHPGLEKVYIVISGRRNGIDEHLTYEVTSETQLQQSDS